MALVTDIEGDSKLDESNGKADAPAKPAQGRQPARAEPARAERTLRDEGVGRGMAFVDAPAGSPRPPAKPDAASADGASADPLLDRPGADRSAAAAETKPQDRLKVFISYARDDALFADQLVLALEERGFEPLIDRRDAPGAEQLKARLRGMLFRSDTLVFVLSESSSISPICAWEVAEAQRIGKRLIPVAPAPVDRVRPPAALMGQSAILFYPDPAVPGSGFYDGILKLDRALKVDLPWIREATRLAEAAAAWAADGRTDDRLLRGQALIDAEAWRLRAPAGMEIRATTLAYLAASADLDARRRADVEVELAERRKEIAALAAEQQVWTERSKAESAVRESQVAAAQARERAATMLARMSLLGLVLTGVAAAATTAGASYLYQERQTALLRESRYLAGFAEEVRAAGDVPGALALAWEALPHEEERIPRPLAPEALRVLTEARYERPEVQIVRGHQDAVQAAALSPDGERLATASEDGTARIWNADTREEIAVLRGHEGPLTSLAWSPDGQSIATAAEDGAARLWHGRAGDEIAVLRGHAGAVMSVAFSADGERLVTAGSDGAVRLWNGATGAPLAELRGRTGVAADAVFSPDGTRLAVAYSDGAARLLEAATGAELAVLRGHDDWVRSIAFSPDGMRLATASSDGTARVWDVVTGAELLVLEGHEREVNAVTWSPDGARLATASRDRTARLWDGRTGALLAVVRGHEGGVTSVAFGPEGASLVTASADGATRVRPVWTDVATLVAESGVLVAEHPLTPEQRCRYHLDPDAVCSAAAAPVSQGAPSPPADADALPDDGAPAEAASLAPRAGARASAAGGRR